MTNEMIVEQIRNGYSVTDNMKMLYENNLPLIKQIIRPYTVYEDMEDLLQEAYFGLWEAVQHYESSENVLFMTYSWYWIRQSVQHYLVQSGSVLRIPSYTRKKIGRYKKTVASLSQELGREPTDAEVAKSMKLLILEVQEIKNYMQDIISLDVPLSAADEVTLQDSIQADINIEDDTVNKIYRQYEESELWEIVAEHTNTRECDIIKDIFVNKKSLAAVGKTQGLSANRVRQIKESGLRKLRMGKARRTLLDKFEIIEAKEYRNGIGKFKRYGCSTVEYVAMRRAEIEEEYKRRIGQIAKIPM